MLKAANQLKINQSLRRDALLDILTNWMNQMGWMLRADWFEPYWSSITSRCLAILPSPETICKTEPAFSSGVHWPGRRLRHAVYTLRIAAKGSLPGMDSMSAFASLCQPLHWNFQFGSDTSKLSKSSGWIFVLWHLFTARRLDFMFGPQTLAAKVWRALHQKWFQHQLNRFNWCHQSGRSAVFSRTFSLHLLSHLRWPVSAAPSVEWVIKHIDRVDHEQ